LLLFWKKTKVFNKSSPLFEYFCCCWHFIKMFIVFSMQFNPDLRSNAL
jgi:hypothetical protein